MRSCNNCLENNWKYKFNEGMVEATCQHCRNVVEFEAKKKVKKVKKKKKFDQWKFLSQHFNKPKKQKKKNWQNRPCNVGSWD